MSSDDKHFPKNCASAKQGVVIVECTSRHLDPAQPYQLLNRNKVSGTAFLVGHQYWPAAAPWNRPGENMLFITCWHVVESAEQRRCRVRMASHGPGSWVSAKVVYAIPTLDFAIIAVDLTEEESDNPFMSASPQILLSDTRELELQTTPVRATQQKIFCVGFPLGYLETYTSMGSIGGRNSGFVCDDYFSLDLSLNSGYVLFLQHYFLCFSNTISYSFTFTSQQQFWRSSVSEPGRGRQPPRLQYCRSDRIR